MAYLERMIGEPLIGAFDHNDKLRKDRQNSMAINSIDAQTKPLLAKITQYARQHKPDANSQLSRLQELHEHFASQAFTVKKYGDLLGQVDRDFLFSVEQ